MVISANWICSHVLISERNYIEYNGISENTMNCDKELMRMDISSYSVRVLVTCDFKSIAFKNRKYGVAQSGFCRSTYSLYVMVLMQT